MFKLFFAKKSLRKAIKEAKSDIKLELKQDRVLAEATAFAHYSAIFNGGYGRHDKVLNFLKKEAKSWLDNQEVLYLQYCYSLGFSF